MTPDPVHAAALARPEAPAVVLPEHVVTYRTLDRRVEGAARRLRALGLRPGDRLAIHRPLDLEALVLLLGALRAGLVVAPLSTRQPAAAVPDLVQRLEARALVGEGGLRIEEVVGMEAEPRGVPDWALERPATLLFTSGSTGAPRAVLHTLGNHVWSARGWAERLPLGPGDGWLLELPLYHVAGLAVAFRCVLAGATVVLAPGGPAEARRLGVTHASMVATQLIRALRGPEAEALAGLRALLLGGSAIPTGLLEEASRLGLPVSTSYGLTEMASTVTATAPGDAPEALATAGAILPHRELRIAEDGEILVRGRTLFGGYLEGGNVRRPEEGEGWFATRDLGRWAEAGGRRLLEVLGRKDHLFISGGENVQPEEVEAALARLPGVARAVVVPVPDAEFGHRPAAFVEAEAWAPGAWREALAEVLPRFKVPEAFHPWPAWAEAGVKPDRRRLRAEALRRSRAG